MRLPILILHGFGGVYPWRRESHLRWLAEFLAAEGFPAAAPAVQPYDGIALRAQRWSGHLDAFLQSSGASQVNLLALSMGGLDARYMISHLGRAPQVASLTTVSTPHRGTGLALYGERRLKWVRQAFIGSMHVMGRLSYPTVEPHVKEALTQLTPQYVRGVFARLAPNHPAVAYFSFSGAAGRGTRHGISPLLAAQNWILHDLEGVNDGLVSVNSGKWGEFLGVVEADHLQQSGWQVTPAAFDHKAFYLDWARELGRLGF